MTVARNDTRILLVEDDPAQCRALALLLEGGGRTVTALTTLEAARVAIAEHPFGVCIIDRNLEGESDGLELLALARDRNPYACCLLLTGAATLDSAIEALRLGAFDYLEKPVDAELLRQKVERAVNAYCTEVEREMHLARYQALFGAVPAVVWLVADNGVIQRVNEEGAEALGYRADELAGAPFEVLTGPNPSERVRWAFRERRTGERATRNERICLLTKDGQPRTFEVTSAGVYGRTPSGERRLLCSTVVGRDVTDEEILQRRLLDLKKMEAVARLAGGLAHDFNNMLASISLGAELLSEELADRPELRAEVDEIVEAAATASSLTRSLVAVSRGQAVKPEELEVDPAVSRLERSLARLVGPGRELVLDLDAAGVSVTLGPGQLEQILVNLVLNAAAAFDDKAGTVRIRTTPLVLDEESAGLHPALKPGSYLQLTVNDDGAGMSDDVQHRALEPFFSTRREKGGSGLGLPVVYGIAAQAGGDLEIQSRPGWGTRITVTLPSVSELPAPPPSDPGVAASVDDNGIILVCEDDARIRTLVRQLLVKEGYPFVVDAQDAEAALALDEGVVERVKLLVTDLSMPGMGGAQLARQLRQRLPALRVVYMSGYAPHSDHALLEDAAFLPKPVSRATLLDTVRGQLRPH